MHVGECDHVVAMDVAMKVVHGIACLALGLGLGYVTRPSPAVPADHHQQAVAQRADRVQTGLPLASSTFSHHDDAPALPTAAPAPEVERARTIVDDATARGVWTEADREALREQLATMTGDDQADVVARLASAINRGTVRVTADLPL